MTVGQRYVGTITGLELCKTILSKPGPPMLSNGMVNFGLHAGDIVTVQRETWPGRTYIVAYDGQVQYIDGWRATVDVVLDLLKQSAAGRGKR